MMPILDVAYRSGEAAMEKHLSSSFAKQPPTLASSVTRKPLAATQRATKTAERKLSREDISRCINIWARMYHQQDDKLPAHHDLCLPSRPWMGRSPNSIKRFE